MYFASFLQNEDSNDSLQSVESSTNLSGGGGGGSGTTTPPVGGVAGGQIGKNWCKIIKKVIFFNVGAASLILIVAYS